MLIARLPRQLWPFLLAHLALFMLLWWVQDNFARLLWKVGGLLTNLPEQTQGAYLLATWLVARWPVYTILVLGLAGLYVAVLQPPEGRQPRKSLLWLCWLPLMFGYLVILWLTFAQRVPIQILQRRIGGSPVTQVEPGRTVP